MEGRAGNFYPQIGIAGTGSYEAFVPRPLPPEPPLQWDIDIIRLLSEADQALGRLDGAARNILNPDLFVAMYVRREAVLSSQIEGTQSTIDDVLKYELNEGFAGLPPDVNEVVNYVRAMNFGLERLASLPLSLRLIREIHGELLHEVRGAERSPGEFRTSQNWIGVANSPITRATFVPPPVTEMHTALSDLERFLHDDSLPALVHSALAHAQFETIHPFMDGNGRVGRLLITFLLVHRSVLHRPLLYLSVFLKRNRVEYYDRLMAIRRDGDWEGWVRFFLAGVVESAKEATESARAINDLRERARNLLQSVNAGMRALDLLDILFQRPLVNVNLVKDVLGIAFLTANRLVERFVAMGILEEVTGAQRNRMFRYPAYLSIFEEHEESEPERGPEVASTRTATS